MSSDLHKWAIPKVQSLLPVDEETASQVVDQAISQGSSEAIADYLKVCWSVATHIFASQLELRALLIGDYV